MNKLLILNVALFAVTTIAACNSKTDNAATAGTPIASVNVNNLKVTLANSHGQLKQGEQELTLTFHDPSGKTVDIGAVSLNFHMPAMGSMAAMNDAVTLTTTATPGVYSGKVNISMAGEWQGQLAFEGPAGKGKATFSVTAR